MNQEIVESYILKLPGTSKVFSEDKKLAIYEYKDEMFALVEQGKKPLRISLRCDKQLANLLKEEYDEVMAGHKLNKNKWITVVVSGQLSDQEIKDLIIHSYMQVKEIQS
jgi:predicted DNA-binding protein (MmcQ/YjbR family)